MNNFSYMEKYSYEQLCYFYDKNTGLKAITCIHNTVLGPALGGTRLWDYADENTALEDVLRLARGMTYKSAMAGLDLGGGKSVILGNVNEIRKDSSRREAFWRAFGRYIQGLNGRYITAEDVNSSTLDMSYVNRETNYVVGLPSKSGDPSPVTAYGIFRAMQATAKFVYGTDDLKGKVVTLQGCGNVGYNLALLLHKAGATLIVCDIDSQRANRIVKEFGAKAVQENEIYSEQCDIYAPCALGATINDQTIPQLKCKIVCGGANNILKDIILHGKALHDKGIVFTPDYVANAGGLINVHHELLSYNRDAAIKDVDLIFDRVLNLLEVSKQKNIPPQQAADLMAEQRIEFVKNTKSIYLPK